MQANLEQMAGVFAQLQTLCQGSPLNALWKIAAALVDGMFKGRVPNSPALRSLLKKSDKELKRLLEQGMVAVNQPAPEELLTSLLFYIAKAEHPTSKMLALKNHYELDEAMPDAAMVDEERARLTKTQHGQGIGDLAQGRHQAAQLRDVRTVAAHNGAEDLGGEKRQWRGRAVAELYCDHMYTVKESKLARRGIEDGHGEDNHLHTPTTKLNF